MRLKNVRQVWKTLDTAVFPLTVRAISTAEDTVTLVAAVEGVLARVADDPNFSQLAPELQADICASVEASKATQEMAPILADCRAESLKMRDDVRAMLREA